MGELVEFCSLIYANISRHFRGEEDYAKPQNYTSHLLHVHTQGEFNPLHEAAIKLSMCPADDIWL